MKSKNLLEFINAEFFEDFKSLDEFLIDLQSTTNHTLPSIHFAAENGAFDLVKKLLDFRPELLNSEDDLGQTPLLWASANGHLDIVCYLLYLHADFKKSTQKPGSRDDNMSPLHWAVLNGHPSVVDILLTYGANPNTRIGKANRHPIHYASKDGRLNILKILLKHEPACIEYKDKYDKTALMHASSNGHTHLVKYLLLKDADLYACTKAHKKTALTLALENKHYETANLLIIKLTHQQQDTNILPFIESGLQAILLMIEKPNLIDLLVKDSRTCSLIFDEENNRVAIQPYTIHLYKKAARRKSSYTRINTKNSTVSVFNPVSQIGSGSFGMVRLFQDNKEQCIAIKSPIKNLDTLSKKEKETINNAVIREAKFNALAYPSEDLPKICTFNFFGKKKDTYTYRYVMPFNEGKQAHIVISETSDVIQLAHLILNIAEELHRIHQVGILHRDIYEKNILILKTENDFVVRFIDFGHSCYLTDDAVELFLLDDINEDKWYAPEIRATSREDKTEIKPHTNQDVYSLGYFLKGHVLNQELLNLFPTINTFISHSQALKPEDRISLESFCKVLKNDLLCYDNINSNILKFIVF